MRLDRLALFGIAIVAACNARSERRRRRRRRFSTCSSSCAWTTSNISNDDMVDLFDTTPLLKPYTFSPRRVPEELNGADAPLAAESMAIDFSRPDSTPRGHILWKSVKGDSEPSWARAPSSTSIPTATATDRRDGARRFTLDTNQAKIAPSCAPSRSSARR